MGTLAPPRQGTGEARGSKKQSWLFFITNYFKKIAILRFRPGPLFGSAPLGVQS